MSWNEKHKTSFHSLEPMDKPRKDWGKAFKEMRENNDDALLIDDVFEDES